MSNDRSESEQDQDRRLRQLLLAGIPQPDGWELPTPADPPAASEPAALQRAFRDIAALQAASLGSWRPHPEGYGFIEVPGRAGDWQHLTAGTKLELLKHWIDWSSISRRDRAALLLAQVDAREVQPPVLSRLTADAGRAGLDALRHLLSGPGQGRDDHDHGQER
jgi:hypothetical protein